MDIQLLEIAGLRSAIHGMRNPMNSWHLSDSGYCQENGIACINCANYKCDHVFDGSYQIGRQDFNLALKLIDAGTDHCKFRRMITVWVDITAPLYWWKEFDTYKVGTVANSCSTMHKIHEKKFTIDDFSHEYLYKKEDCFYGDMVSYDYLEMTISVLNNYRDKYNISKQKKDWYQMIQLLPSSYNQKRTVMMNYEVLANIYNARKDHKLDEWREFCHWIDELPYRDLIIRKEK